MCSSYGWSQPFFTVLLRWIGGPSQDWRDAATLLNALDEFLFRIFCGAMDGIIAAPASSVCVAIRAKERNDEGVERGTDCTGW
jgi:hypothetical protein